MKRTLNLKISLFKNTPIVNDYIFDTFLKNKKDRIFPRPFLKKDF